MKLDLESSIGTLRDTTEALALIRGEGETVGGVLPNVIAGAPARHEREPLSVELHLLGGRERDLRAGDNEAHGPVDSSLYAVPCWSVTVWRPFLGSPIPVSQALQI